MLVAGDTDTIVPLRPTIIGRSPTDSVTRPSKSQVSSLQVPSGSVMEVHHSVCILALGSGQRLLYRLGSGLGLVLVLVLV